MRVTASPTPNPNAIKFTADDGVFVDDGMASYSSPAQADVDPLGRRLFSVPGVASVFITPGFVTVTKNPSVSWDGLMEELSRRLSDFLDAAGEHPG